METEPKFGASESVWNNNEILHQDVELRVREQEAGSVVLHPFHTGVKRIQSLKFRNCVQTKLLQCLGVFVDEFFRQRAK